MHGLPLLASTNDPLDWEDASPEELEELVNLRVAVRIPDSSQFERGVILRYDEGCRMHLIEYDEDDLEDRWHNLCLDKWKVVTGDSEPEPEPEPEPEERPQKRAAEQEARGGVSKKRPRHEPPGAVPTFLTKVLNSSCISTARGQCFLTTSQRLLNSLFPRVSLSDLPAEVKLMETDTSRVLYPTLREYSTGYFFCGNGWREVISKCALLVGDSITLQRCDRDTGQALFSVAKKQSKPRASKPSGCDGSNTAPVAELYCANCSKGFLSMTSLRSHKRWCDSSNTDKPVQEAVKGAPPVKKCVEKSTSKVLERAVEVDPVERRTVFVNSHWNLCYVCSTADRLLCCDLCPNMFHAACVNLDTAQKPWACSQCRRSSECSQVKDLRRRANYTKEEQLRIPARERLQGVYSLTEVFA